MFQLYQWDLVCNNEKNSYDVSCIIRLSRKMHKGVVFNLQEFSVSRMSSSLQEPIKEDLYIYVLYKPETRRRYILSCTIWEHLNNRVFFYQNVLGFLSWYPTISRRFFSFDQIYSLVTKGTVLNCIICFIHFTYTSKWHNYHLWCFLHLQNYHIEYLYVWISIRHVYKLSCDYKLCCKHSIHTHKWFHVIKWWVFSSCLSYY